MTWFRCIIVLRPNIVLTCGPVSALVRLHSMQCAAMGVLCIAFALAPTAHARQVGGEAVELARVAQTYRDCAMPSEYEVAVALGIEEQWTLDSQRNRFFNDDIVWTGDGALGPAGWAQPANLTYSFPADGTLWGIDAIFNQIGPNNLDGVLRQMFGPTKLDLGHEYIRQAIASWAHFSGLHYNEVADDRSPSDTNGARVATRGDVRIGGVSFFLAPFAAYNAFPSNDGIAKIGGSDMVLNNSFWPLAQFGDPTDDYRFFRVLIAHEHGHGLGLIHTTPCVGSKLMEPFVNELHIGPMVDDLRAAGANYGDRFAGNHALASAHDFGNLTSPKVRSVIVRGLSTNGVMGPDNTGEDWFRFTLSTTQNVTIDIAPTGGVYEAAQQGSACFYSEDSPLVDAQFAGNLDIELIDMSQAQMIASAASADRSFPETISMLTLAPGEYAFRVHDIGPNFSETLQRYDLTIRVGSALASPDPCAGINKRVPIGRDCYFLGHINSTATEPGAVLTPQSFDWDLDGDGLFETIGNSAPVISYSAPGEYAVTLRLTDSLGSRATHSFTVSAFIPVTRVSGIRPGAAPGGGTISVQLAGEFLEGIVSPDQITVLGGGVTVSGSPIVDESGTLLSGLSFDVDAGAATGLRTVMISTDAGEQAAEVTFSITPALPEAFGILFPSPGQQVDTSEILLSWEPSVGASAYALQLRIDDDDDGVLDRVVLSAQLGQVTSHLLSAGSLIPNHSYEWSVQALNGSGSQAASPEMATFRTRLCPGDANADKQVTFDDIEQILFAWGRSYSPGRSGPGDSNGDSFVNFADITASLSSWGATCP